MNETFKNLMLFYALNIHKRIKYIAVDKDGRMFGYTHCPEKFKSEWVNGVVGNHRQIECPIFNMTDINWEETLINLT